MSGDAHADLTGVPRVRLTIEPEPTAQELAAIVGAVTALRRATFPGSGAGTAPRPDAAGPSRWAMAGRLEAMRGLAADEDRRP
ncbi:MAG: hypothetical protein WBA46_03650 [Thermomicrobiales bacterium]